LKNSIKVRNLIFKVILPLSVSIIIYLLFRPLTLKGYNLIDTQIIIQLREFRYYLNDIISIIPKWVIYCLPDGLWIYSFTSAMILIFEKKPHQLIFISLPILMAYIHELCQLFLINYGTFDSFDLLTYCVFYFFSIFSFYSPKNYLALFKKKHL